MGVMQSLKDIDPVQQSNNERSAEETVEAAILLLKGLNSLQEKADAEGFGFLSYLLRMAILEAQAIASGSTGESDELRHETGDSSYGAGSPDDVGSPTYGCRC